MNTKLDVTRAFLIKTLPNPTHAFTISFKSAKLPIDKEEKLLLASNSFFWLVRILNDRCLGKSHRKNGKRIGCTAIAEGMGSEKRLHLHGSLKKPSHIKSDVFIQKIKKAATKVRSFGNIQIDDWRDEGWTNYITKEMDCEVLWDHCHSGNP